MKTAAVCIDSWKLPIFKRHLDEAGYSYTEGPGITDNTLMLKVKYEWAADLTPVVEAANQECARQ